MGNHSFLHSIKLRNILLYSYDLVITIFQFIFIYAKTIRSFHFMFQLI